MFGPWLCWSSRDVRLNLCALQGVRGGLDATEEELLRDPDNGPPQQVQVVFGQFPGHLEEGHSRTATVRTELDVVEHDPVAILLPLPSLVSLSYSLLEPFHSVATTSLFLIPVAIVLLVLLVLIVRVPEDRIEVWNAVLGCGWVYYSNLK